MGQTKHIVFSKWVRKVFFSIVIQSITAYVMACFGILISVEDLLF